MEELARRAAQELIVQQAKNAPGPLAKLARGLWERFRSGKKLSSLSDLAVLAHTTSQTVRNIVDIVLVSDFSAEKSAELCASQLKQEITVVLDKLAAYFHDHVTHCETAACIKMLCNKEQIDKLGQSGHIRRPVNRKIAETEPIVFTLARDRLSEATRGRSAYYLNDSTAFRSVWSGQFMYCPDEDLFELKEKGAYENPTPEFWKFYRSAMVLPIRWSPPDDLSSLMSPIVVGFLAVDAREAGKFCGQRRREQQLSKMPDQFNIAAHVADALYFPLSLLITRGTNGLKPDQHYASAKQSQGG